MGDEDQHEVSPGASGYRSRRRGWERVTGDARAAHGARETMQEGGLSPRQEVIAKADQELCTNSETDDDQAIADEPCESTVTCF